MKPKPRIYPASRPRPYRWTPLELVVAAAIAVAIVLIGLSVARSQTVADPYAHIAPASAFERPNPTCFAKLPALAKRLHVGPAGFGALVAHGCDGQAYDVIALIGALLDRMDRAAPVVHVPVPKPRPIEVPR